MTRPGVIIWEALRNAFKRKKATIDYPFEPGIKPKKGLRGAHVLILELCTGCRACERACPPVAIEMVPSEVTKTGKRPVINLGECIFCGLCEEACRYDALFLTDYIELSAFGRGEMIIYEKEDPASVKKAKEAKEEDQS
ncbi:MAG: NADH-quinone oxidoreductase subunit I [Asgard group archaeon]|nr:NADH-quinone oxidoreductase subunit I [Asgard group archaeon]